MLHNAINLFRLLVLRNIVRAPQTYLGYWESHYRNGLHELKRFINQHSFVDGIANFPLSEPSLSLLKKTAIFLASIERFRSERYSASGIGMDRKCTSYLCQIVRVDSWDRHWFYNLKRTSFLYLLGSYGGIRSMLFGMHVNCLGENNTYCIRICFRAFRSWFGRHRGLIVELESHIYRYDIWMFEILIYRQQSMHMLLYTAWFGQIDTNAYCRKIWFRALIPTFRLCFSDSLNLKSLR